SASAPHMSPVRSRSPAPSFSPLQRYRHPGRGVGLTPECGLDCFRYMREPMPQVFILRRGAEHHVDNDFTSLMEAADRGGSAAAKALFGALYSDLHCLARRELARRGGAVSLSVTTLLHEAYLDMAGRSAAIFPDQARFMGY